QSALCHRSLRFSCDNSAIFPATCWLLISNAQDVITQQHFLLVDLVEERACKITCVNDALGTSRSIENRDTAQRTRIHGVPDPLQRLVDMTGKNGVSHDRSGLH